MIVMRRYLGIVVFVLIVISISLIIYSLLLIMDRVQNRYTAVEIPTYNFEIIGSGN